MLAQLTPGPGQGGRGSGRNNSFFPSASTSSNGSRSTSGLGSSLMRFYYADEELNMIASELDSFDGRKDPVRCTNLVNQLRYVVKYFTFRGYKGLYWNSWRNRWVNCVGGIKKVGRWEASEWACHRPRHVSLTFILLCRAFFTFLPFTSWSNSWVMLCVKSNRIQR